MSSIIMKSEISKRIYNFVKGYKANKVPKKVIETKDQLVSK